MLAFLKAESDIRVQLLRELADSTRPLLMGKTCFVRDYRLSTDGNVNSCNVECVITSVTHDGHGLVVELLYCNNGCLHFIEKNLSDIDRIEGL